ncbi:uncharacterized protein N7525_011193 [Penicillium rubens]|uniref:uncharacterized protein n=1 Tax=Penicillium rubens TaxID=1108849 RepID=UPI002A5ACD62|nr:uncharacterized protein N7525_011193 [Penicillium rubens]KAJ5821909.1 hypothetical protein N7525_011193 [Penicillium rubens]KAJ5859550.1 hypothetical protein N7534_004827 [Penicillium rubens]
MEYANDFLFFTQVLADLLICLAAGIRPVITSSSDQKLQLAKTDGCPGAADTINYRDQPKWEEEARRLRTDEVSMVLSRTLGLPRRGTVSLVGSLAGFDVDRFPDTILPMTKSATIRGISADHQALCDFLADKQVGLKPVLDNVTFSFEDSQAAFDHLWNAKHMAKL